MRGLLPADAPVHYTLAEVGAILRRSTKTLRRWIQDGRLIASQPMPRSEWLVHRNDLETLLEEMRRR